MPRYELLNNIAHKDLRVTTRYGAEFGDSVAMVPVFPTEFADVQREYPIFFRKEEDGRLQAVALLGFERDENLFLQGDRWLAGYVPAVMSRGPFLIGQQEQDVDGERRLESVIHVDMEHVRIDRDGSGEPVFLPQGGHSPYLEHIVGVLRGINEGSETAGPMLATLDGMGLIQPVSLDIRFDESRGTNLTGLHGIDREALAALDADTLLRLHRSGLLEGVYMVLASLHNLRRMIGEKQRRLRAQDEAVPASAN